MTKALNFTAPPAAERIPWYRMESIGTDHAEIFIYEAIGGWFGVEASSFVKELAELDVKNIVLRVNSPGGSVYDGVAIMNALRRHPANITASIDGLAASAASFIVQAADEVVMGRGSEMMIHDALTYTVGNAAELAKDAEHLDRISDTIAGLYAERAGGTKEEWRDAMREETWYSAEEAVSAGLADSVEGSDSDAKSAKDLANRFDLSIFAHAGRGNAPAPHVPTAIHRRARAEVSPETLTQLVAQTTPTPPAQPPADNQSKPTEGIDNMSKELIEGLRTRLGINAEATLTDTELLAAVDEALAEQDEESAATAAPAASATPAPGTVVLDQEQHASLVSDAAAGREARKRQLEDDRKALVNAAVLDGRIAPSRVEHWENSLAADPGAAAVLATLEKGLIPVDAIGYTGGVDESSDEDSTYNKLYPKEA